MDLPILSIVTFLPLVGAAAILFGVRRDHELLARHVAFWTSVVTFLASLPLAFRFDRTTAAMQFVEVHDWIPAFGIHYHVGVDGISLLLVLLTTLLSMIAILSTWTAVTTRVKEFMVAMLVLETSMIGVFIALDFFLFYLFWEAMLIPMYLLIGVWGGERRIYAAVKFFLYTLAGSVLMLVAILALYFKAGRTFDIQAIAQQAQGFSPAFQAWVFGALFVAFAVKVPMFPFHTWLPDAHVEAPTAGSVILAGVLLKMGTYGFLRFLIPLCPDALPRFLPAIMVLSGIAIIYGALMALAQKDLKKLVAYSSVSHMGYITLGLFALNPQGMEGGILQMINHGISTGALFLLVGVIYERRHTRLIAEFGGLTRVMPLYAVFFSIFTMSSIGLPGLNGFVGEFLTLVGVFHSPYRLYAVVGAFGIILGAGYMLWMFQRVMFNKLDNPKNFDLADLNVREFAVLAPLVVLAVWIGVYPDPFLAILHPSVNQLLGHTQVAVASLGGLP
ncbi:MAG: NADH-quinone oxidoreductase subunit M [Nitrospirae bacterium]|nr:MAG: NADH-quinone oxidoreductase subunit M [Nitrospirota bacterium]